MMSNKILDCISEKTRLSGPSVKRLFVAVAIISTTTFDLAAGGHELKTLYREGPITTTLLATFGPIGLFHAWYLKKKGSIRNRLKIELRWAAAFVIGMPADSYVGAHNPSVEHVPAIHKSALLISVPIQPK